MLVLNIFCMSSARGTVSKALLISIVARNVVVEVRDLKPCCVGDRRMCGVVVLGISLSRVLIGLHKEEICQ